MTGTSTRKPRRRRTPVILAVALGALVGSPGFASASASVPQAGDSNRTNAEVVSYWTPKRMEQARPAKVVPVDSGGGGTPEPQASPTIPFTRTQVPDTTVLPYRLHGRVFFHDPNNGVNYSCSGTAVDSANLATVVTAGHCVNRSGAWNTNFVFVPGYHDGVRPYGTWAASDESAPSGWVVNRSFRYDVGVAVMAKDSNGQLLDDAIGGSRGILFNQPVTSTAAVTSYGYPADHTSIPEFTGNKLFACDSVLGFLDPYFPGLPPTLGIGCDMTGGSSGGGWVITDTSTGTGYVNGVNSYKYTNPPQPNVMYGPYFGTDAKAVYDALSAEEPGLPGTPSSGGDSSSPAAPPASSPVVPASTPRRVICFKKAKKKHGKKKKKKNKKRVCRQV